MTISGVLQARRRAGTAQDQILNHNRNDNKKTVIIIQILFLVCGYIKNTKYTSKCVSIRPTD